VVVADYNLEAARELAGEVGGKTSAVKVDALDRSSLVETIKGADAVISYVGPYYVFGEPVVKAAIEAKTPLVDICDDADAALKILAYDGPAREAGITIITGLGATPGITNLMALRGSEELERVDEIDTSWAWTALDPKMKGRAIVDHYFHAISGNIKTYRNGNWVDIPALSVSRNVEFSSPIGLFEVSEVGHPEPVTIPRYIKGVRNVTNNGGIWPKRFKEMAMFLSSLGLPNLIEINVNEHKVYARDVATAVILSLPVIAADLVEAMVRETLEQYGEFGLEGVCLRVDVRGEKGGRPAQCSYRCCGAADLLTSLPSVLGAMMIVDGEVKKKGIFGPEGVIDQKIFFDRLKKDIPIEKISAEFL
jgi:saccharopine dehydrogenase-like NADP-dependent oxidoreductase